MRLQKPVKIAVRFGPAKRIRGFVARVGQQANPVTEDVSFEKPDQTVRLQETTEVYIQKAACK